jgi:hypothetical protein
MPGPRPTPTHLQLLRGNPSKRPLNKGEPVPDIPAAVPEPPAFLCRPPKTNGGRSGPSSTA